MKTLLGAGAIVTGSYDAPASGGLDDPRSPREIIRGTPIETVRARLAKRKARIDARHERREAAKAARAARRAHRSRGAR